VDIISSRDERCITRRRVTGTREKHPRGTVSKRVAAVLRDAGPEDVFEKKP